MGGGDISWPTNDLWLMPAGGFSRLPFPSLRMSSIDAPALWAADAASPNRVAFK